MQTKASERLLRQALAQRILLLDGAMGTMIQAEKLSDAEFRGDRFREHPHELSGNNDLLTLTQPDVISKIHRAYLDAGADIIETNTFNSTRSSQADYQLQDISYELNFAATTLARQVCDEANQVSPGKPRFVAGILGPTSKTTSISGDVNDPGFRSISFDELAEDYGNSTNGLIDGG